MVLIYYNYYADRQNKAYGELIEYSEKYNFTWELTINSKNNATYLI